MIRTVVKTVKVESLTISSGMRAHELVFKGNVPVTLSFVAFFIFLFNKYFLGTFYMWAFPDSSVGKEFACNEGDLGSMPGSGRSTGEGIGYPLQYSWASLVAQLVKMCLQCGRPEFDPWVGKIAWRRKRLFWPGEFHGLYSPWGCKESDTTEWLSLTTCETLLITRNATIKSLPSKSLHLSREEKNKQAKCHE